MRGLQSCAIDRFVGKNYVDSDAGSERGNTFLAGRLNRPVGEVQSECIIVLINVYKYIHHGQRCATPLFGRSRLSSHSRGCAFRKQVSLYERIEVTIEHPIGIADLQLRSMVLDHAIGMQHVRADLVAEGYITFGLLELLG